MSWTGHYGKADGIEKLVTAVEREERFFIIFIQEEHKAKELKG
jgi:hypothetical protein